MSKMKIGGILLLVAILGMGNKIYRDGERIKQEEKKKQEVEKMVAIDREQRRLEATKNWPITKKLYLSCAKLLKSVRKDLVEAISDKDKENKAFSTLYNTKLICKDLLDRAHTSTRTSRDTETIAHNLLADFYLFVGDTDNSYYYQDRYSKGEYVEEQKIGVRQDTALVVELIEDITIKIDTAVIEMNNILHKKEGL